MIFKTFDSDNDKVSSKWGLLGRSFNDIGTAIIGRIKDIKNSFHATDDLFGSFHDSDGILKRLYPSKDSIQSQLIDVDSLYPKIDKSAANNILKHLQQQQKSVDLNKGSWQNYFNELKEHQFTTFLQKRITYRILCCIMSLTKYTTKESDPIR